MRVGVVVPAFNAAAWIGDAVASVLAQTHRDWVLVVVDDGSTDTTGEIVARIADPRIRLIRQANSGVSAARNRGAAEFLGGVPAPQPPSARGRGGCSDTHPPLPSRDGGGGRGRAVLFLDADDWLAPDALSRLAAALDASPRAVAASGACVFVDTGVVRVPPSGEMLHRLLVRNPFANGGHLLLRADAVRAVGGFVAGIAFGEDWEFWVRMAMQGPFVAASGRAPVLFVRQHAGGAYQRLAVEPTAFTPCMDSIFGNPALLARFGAVGLAAIRRRAEAENDWIIGRELIRHGRRDDGRARLRRSVVAYPSIRRAAILGFAHLLALIPANWRGPLRPYATVGACRRECGPTPGC